VTPTSLAPCAAGEHKRTAIRHAVALPARLTWKDQRGATRFVSVVARNVSEHGVYVECQSPISIARFRLVQLQLERDAREVTEVPAALRQGRTLSAVYRVSPPSRAGRLQGLGLRLLVPPTRAHGAVSDYAPARATA
jgi:hypothetical protein